MTTDSSTATQAASSESARFRVALTEGHGMTLELARHPPPGVAYSFVECAQETPRWIRSPIKGFLREFRCSEDVIEAIISPIRTQQPWIYSLACAQEAFAFSLFGLPTPRAVRRTFLNRLLRDRALKAIVFWSAAGLRTLSEYGGVDDGEIVRKSTVVYPAVGHVPDDQLVYRDEVSTLLFSGDFFRKGGAAVVDAFQILQRRYPGLRLIVCSSAELDFSTVNHALRERYLKALRTNSRIEFIGRVPRERLIADILPRSDIYLIPTLAEAFGFAILEAMAFGVPVIATRHFAIPELIRSGVSGELIDIDSFGVERIFSGYVVRDIPPRLHEHMVESITARVSRLIEDRAYRAAIRSAALQSARSTFSVAERNKRMLELYRRAASD